MNGLLWNRGARITFGPRELAGPAMSFNRKSIEGLRVSFEIEKTSETSANMGKITIYNLSRDLWGLLQTCPNPFVILEVGYGRIPDKKLIVDELFHGDIKNMQYIHQGPDTLTILEAGDGSLALEQARVDKSWEGADLEKNRAGASLKLAAEDVLNSLRNAGRVVIKDAVEYLKSGAVKDKKAQAGLSLSGMARDILDKLLGSLNLEWSIQDDKVQILPQNGCPLEIMTILTPSTGLVGSPTRKAEGIEFTALIQTKIKPGARIKIESRDVTGEFRVKRAKFIGDTHDNPFYVVAEAMEAI